MKNPATMTAVATSEVAAGAIGLNAGTISAISTGVATAAPAEPEAAIPAVPSPPPNQFIGDNQRNTGHDNYCHTQQDPHKLSLGNHSQINGIAQREGKEWDY